MCRKKHPEGGLWVTPSNLIRWEIAKWIGLLGDKHATIHVAKGDPLLVINIGVAFSDPRRWPQYPQWIRCPRSRSVAWFTGGYLMGRPLGVWHTAWLVAHNRFWCGCPIFLHKKCPKAAMSPQLALGHRGDYPLRLVELLGLEFHGLGLRDHRICHRQRHNS